MAYWAIKAYDDIYGGLHGMQEVEILRGTEDEASQIASEMAGDVIDSYYDIRDALEEKVERICELEGIDLEDESEVDEIRGEVYDEDVQWEIYELDITKLPTVNTMELRDMFYNNPDEFLKKYAIDY